VLETSRRAFSSSGAISSRSASLIMAAPFNDLPDGESGIFLREGLERVLTDLPVAQNSSG
jgi:hypothetical protein